MFKINKLFMNYMTEPMAFDTMPRLNWILESDRMNVKQTAYQVQLSACRDFTTLLSDSGKTKSSQSAHVMLPVSVLKSASRYYVRAKVWNNYGEESEYCAPLSFLTGILTQKEWTAQFITAECEEDKDKARGTYIRKELSIHKEVEEAFCYTTALGLYHFYINGEKIGQEQMAPGWTSYNSRLLYQSYDVTGHLKSDKNVLAAHIGAGWYKGDMGFERRRNIYGDRTGFLCQLYIRYTDGSSEIISSDESWKGSYSPVLFSEIYDGEEYDARLEQPGWNTASFCDSRWAFVTVTEKSKEILTVQEGCTIKEIDTVPAKSLFTTPAGDTVIDFGQNMSGWVSFRTEGSRNTKIQLRYFETLDKDGNVYLDNLRSAKSMLIYTCAGNDEVSYKPAFTFHGFRYILLEQFPDDASAQDFTAYAVHSDMEQTGTFSCSNPDLNQLQNNILWGLKGNFLDIPTDCPQRDERLGWTGDAQIFCSTATYLMNTYTFFSKWLLDLAADQFPDGGVPHIIPDILSNCSQDNPTEDRLASQGDHSAAAWADAAVINPWTLYLKYGDTQIIEQQYDSMKAWIDFMDMHSENGSWSYKLQYGDWVALDAEEGSYFGATPEDLICSAYFAYTTRIFARMAKAIGREADYNKYSALHESLKDAFGKRYFDENGQMTAQTQTAHIIALYFNLIPEAYIKPTAKRLTELLAKEGGHLVTGFVGTPYFCHALSQNGYLKEAYDLLLKDDFPSWLYQIKKGATTIWEHWDGLKEDGSMWSADMNSFNHYAYGAIGDWMYRVITGIEADENEPGYKHIILSPQIGGGLTHAEGSYQSVYGTIRSSWKVDRNEVELTVTIPVNTTASIRLSQANQLVETDGLSFEPTEYGFICETGSGSYTIKFMQKN